MNNAELAVLLVDDDEIDVMAVRRAFSKLGMTNPLIVACDGIEALALLNGQVDGLRMPRPFVVLLDLNLPRMNGLEFLKAIRADPELENTVVFVMTTSTDETDRRAAYEQNVAGYIVKPSRETEFLELMSGLQDYWRMIEFP